MASTSSRAGLQRGDLLFVAGSDNLTCGMIEVTGNGNADQLTIDHVAGAYNDTQNVATASRFNAPGGFTTASGQLFSLGNRDAPRRNVWQIANRRTLTVTDDLHLTAAIEVGEGIIDLQAQYGLDTDGDFIADTWQSADPVNWRQLIAVRVALLARSQQYEKAAVTNAAPAWTGGAFVMTNLDGAADSNPGDANDWRHYRYRVYQTTIPLRNVLWGITP
jgi:type IV pilus assembly protein PilW